MKIGVISDTHDNVPLVAKAVEAFNKEGCELVIHAGDYCSPFSLNPFSQLKCKWIGIFGNNDGDKKALAIKSNGLIVDPPYRYDLSNTKVMITHVLEEIPDLMGVIARKEFHVIICGHTHKPEIKKYKETLMINPGECGGWTTGKSTVAILDLKTMETKGIELK